MMRVICQFKILTIIVLTFFVLSSKGQVYQEMPQYGYRANRMAFDSTLSIPTVCGVPTLKSNITKKAAIAFDSCNGVFYQYNPKTLAWSQITGGGGGSTDTTSLSNRIDLKLNISDTANMLLQYVNFGDTALMLSKYYRISDTLNKWVNSVTKLNDSTIRVIKDGITSDISITSVSNASRLVTSVYNNSGSTITKGSVVYINGRHSSNYPTIALAQANTEVNSYSTFAMVREDILNNSVGTVIQAGNISNLNLPTSSYTDGELLYLSPTVAGGITTTKPLAPNHIVKIGTVTRAHPTLGSIELKIENGWQLDELSDVQISAVPLDSTILQFSRVDSLWHDVNPTTAMGNRFVKVSDSAAMLSKYLRKTDTTNKFVNSISRVQGKDSIIFYIGGTRYAIKDSLGSGTSAAGNYGQVQWNNYGFFNGATGFKYNPDYKRVEVSNIESGDPVTRLDIHDDYQGAMPRNYEVANFSKVGDVGIGIYNADYYSTGTGASLFFGNTKNTNSANKYPSFQIKNINDSTDWNNSYTQFNYQERNTSGTFVSSTVDLFKIYADGKVQLYPYGFDHTPTPRLIIGEEQLGDATLEVTGNSYLNGKTTTTGARVKHILFLNDDVDGTSYSVISTDHIIFYATTANNCTITLPSTPENGRELTIKQTADYTTYTLTIDAGSNDLYDIGASSGTIDNTVNNQSITLLYYDGAWFLTSGQLN